MKDTHIFRFLTIFLILSAISVCTVASGTISRISIPNSSIVYENPAIYGSNVVWQDSRNGNFALYLYDAISGTESRISENDASNQINPAIYKDLVVYQDDREAGGSNDIFLYNITSGLTTQITNNLADQINPAVYGDHIVWSDNRDDATGMTYQIYINGTSPGTEYAISPAFGTDQQHPQIFGDLVVWQDNRNGNWDIYLFNLTSGQETQITNDVNDQTDPAIFGNRIVWTDNRNGNYEIFINGTFPGLEYSITPDQPLSDHISPSIYDSKIVWAQDTTGIFMNDTSLSPGSLIAIDTLAGSRRSHPKLSLDPTYGDRVVWEEIPLVSRTHEIFLYTAGGSGTCPVADFTNNYLGGTAPIPVTFTDTSTPGATHWLWDFGDGTISTLQNPVHTFTQDIPYDVSLTVGNPYCRNTTIASNAVVVGGPVANFAASPTSDIVPAIISFTDSSTGIPEVWNWSFGDGEWFNTTTAASKSPTHTYYRVGTYTVQLITKNTYGSTTRIRTGYITVLNGANEITNTTIGSLTFNYPAGQQVATIDTAHLTASLIPNSSVLEIQPPADRGFRNITLYALDGSGFSQSGSTITGRITGVHIESQDISPTGFSVATGDVAVNYSIDLPSYPIDATLNTKVWEGAVADDADKFSRIALGSNFAQYSGTAYTTKIFKTNIPDGATAKLRISVNSTWVATHGGRNTMYIERIADDSQTGEVLMTRFTGSDPARNLDYFEADSPRGLCTFGISALSGSGNPFQLITLSIVNYISSSTSSQDSGSPAHGAGPGQAGAAAVAQNPNTPGLKAPPEPVDPGKTAALYTNVQGVITQETVLQSNDNQATVSIPLGVVAQDGKGNPLSSLSIVSVPRASLPSMEPGLEGTYSGMAYDLGPDHATFSPAITFSVTVPQVRWGQDYTIKTHDPVSGAWLDLPSTFDPKTGIVTAKISHLCCFALFAKTITPVTPAPPANGNTPVPAPPKAPVQLPPPTAVSVFTGLLIWAAEVAAKNIQLIIGIILIVCVLAYIRTRMNRRRNFF